MRRSRKSYVCYTPNYKPGIGKYVEVKTKKAMWKVLQKFGAGAVAYVYFMKWNRDGGYTSGPTGKIYSVY